MVYKKTKAFEWYLLNKSVDEFLRAIDEIPVSDHEQVMMYENKIKAAQRDKEILEEENSKLLKSQRFIDFTKF